MLSLLSPQLHFPVLAPRHSLSPFDIEPFDFLHDDRMLLTAPRVSSFGHGLSALPKIEDKGHAYVIRVETPGISKSNLKVEVLGRRTLLVTASNNHPSEPNADPKQNESAQSHAPQLALTLCKRVDLPGDADCSKVHLSYADGLLTAEVAKKKQGCDEATAVEDGDKVGKLQAEAKETAARVQALQAELEEARRAASVAQRSLSEAKAEAARSIAQERRPLLLE